MYQSLIPVVDTEVVGDVVADTEAIVFEPDDSSAGTVHVLVSMMPRRAPRLLQREVAEDTL